MKVVLYYTVLLLLTIVYCDDDNGDNIDCDKCACTESDDAQILNADCTNRNLHHVGGKWPKHNSTIIVSFAGNDIPTLEPLPPTDAVLEIILSRCNIQYLESGLFKQTKNIKFVDLSYNKIIAEQLSADKFKGDYNETAFEPSALENLNLAYNQIHSLPQNLFEHMPNLKYLNLEGNDFTLLDVHTQLALSSIRQLQNLNLANNELTDLITKAIDAHENLTQLNLANNSLDFVPTSLSHIGKSLEILILDGNPIIELVAETFIGLGNITELSINNLTKLKYVTANTFASMPKLKKLRLSNNLQLTDIDREAFGVGQTVEEFYLNNNNLYRLDYHLLPWSKLHIFEFNDNPFDCSCDLYNITQDLTNDIRRKENSPFCSDPRTERYLPVFSLKIDICDFKSKNLERTEYMEYHFSLIRIAVIVLSIVVAVAALLAAALGLLRYRKYRRGLAYPFASSQVAYNPVSTTPKF